MTRVEHTLRLATLFLLGVAASLPQLSNAQILWLVSCISLGIAINVSRFRSFAIASLCGFSFGAGYFVTTLYWLSIVGLDALVGVSALCALWWGLSFGLSSFFRKSAWFPVIVSTFFTTAEIARDTMPWGGFGWAPFSMNFIDSPFAFFLAGIGQSGLGFLLVGLIAFISLTIKNLQESKPHRFTSLGIAIAAVMGSSCLAVFPLSSSGVSTDAANIAFVQGGVDRTGLGVLGDRTSVLRRHIAMTRDNLTTVQEADLVVWPENASDVDPFNDSFAAMALQQLDKELSPPLLFGAVVNRPDGRAGNVSLLLNDSLSEVYAKRRLVPFGEFLPFREQLSRLTDRVALMPRDFQPGTQPGIVEVAGIRLGTLICFEIADQNYALTESKDFDAVVVHTNNATYAGTKQIHQQLGAARIRAMEMQKPVIVVSTSGISAMIEPNGEVQHIIQEGETGVRVVTVTKNQTHTWAAVLVTPISYLLWLASFVLVFCIIVARFRVRS